MRSQSRPPEVVYVISNSDAEAAAAERALCEAEGFFWAVNQRTPNYAGALNTALELLVQAELKSRCEIDPQLYIALLDDDDAWMPDYLRQLEAAHEPELDLLCAWHVRISPQKEVIMQVPDHISERDFFQGNPGLVGSTTFVRLEAALKAGAFDEALPSTVDRDFFVRFFQLSPKYKVIPKVLVQIFAEEDRYRITLDKEAKRRGLQGFYYKYRYFMTPSDEEAFFRRAQGLFGISAEEILALGSGSLPPVRSAPIRIERPSTEPYQLVVGFIAGENYTAERLLRSIQAQALPVHRVIILEDVPKHSSLRAISDILDTLNFEVRIIEESTWRDNLKRGLYGRYFTKFANLRSIPLGRTILHYHLYQESRDLERPVFWVVDDDIRPSCSLRLFPSQEVPDFIDLGALLEQWLQEKCDIVIGGITQDPPVPLLSCVRTQLVDFWYSLWAPPSYTADAWRLHEKPDYYYDLSDLHTDHLEMPIYTAARSESELERLWSGKGVTRPIFQARLEAKTGIVTRRGGNTLILNRQRLRYYPVINLELKGRSVRRGDLVWALMEQLIAKRRLIEHTFSVDHDRPVQPFHLEKELNKSLDDVAGYAFSKSMGEMLVEIQKNAIESQYYKTRDVFRVLSREPYRTRFYELYQYRLYRRGARLLMNLYRIATLVDLIQKHTGTQVFRVNGKEVLQLGKKIGYTLLEYASDKMFFDYLYQMLHITYNYSNALAATEQSDEYEKIILSYFSPHQPLALLGKGSEGIVFTDKKWVYKCLFSEEFYQLEVICRLQQVFSQIPTLSEVELHELKVRSRTTYIIRYPYSPSRPLDGDARGKIPLEPLVGLLRAFRQYDFVYTNIKPSNFVLTIPSGELKLVDYGRSFEPFSEEKYLNAIKRAFILYHHPELSDEEFAELTRQINLGRIPPEAEEWERLWWAVEPRSKKQILDDRVVELLAARSPRRVLDYGSGKCRVARQIVQHTGAIVYVYDIQRDLLENYCKDMPIYNPNDPNFREFFDAALLNIVLCEVEEATVGTILSEVARALKPGGVLVGSVCNPDFVQVRRTEFQHRLSFPADPRQIGIVCKQAVPTGQLRQDYHRPTYWYVELFAQYGFRLVSQEDTPGVDRDTLAPASDFKIFVLERVD